MELSQLIGQRFEIESLAGTGGMGQVYRARDLRTGGRVALKVLSGKREQASARLIREANTLSVLSHPRIVRHVDHGALPTGELYLAMEWLDGEDLARRLSRAPLPLNEAVRLGILLAETLAAAHMHGVIHRDIKPSNVFLVGGDVERMKILDFGLARRGLAPSEISRSGVMLGTPSYMSPEQARLDKKLDHRTDLFSLGCLLFKCLTGQLPFSGENLVAILAKVMLEPAPRVDSMRADLPPALGDLVADLLEKEPEGRPPDGLAVAARLAGLGSLVDSGTFHVLAPSPSITAGERKVVSIVLAYRVTDPAPVSMMEDVAQAAADADTRAETLELPLEVMDALQAAVEPYRARANLLADGSAVVPVFGSAAATDQAARAARCAMALHAVASEVPIALAIGRTAEAEGLGELIDRAALLFRSKDDEPAIFLDEPTARLLEARFEIDAHDGRLRLGKERPIRGGTRTLLGRPTPFVGRTRELATLDAVFAECVGECISRAVLVTGPPGIGKSRLRYEFVGKLEASGVRVWISRGEPMSAGSPFGMLAPMLRRTASILDGDSLEVRRSKLVAYVEEAYGALGDACPEGAINHASEFLGEIVGAPFPEDRSVQLRSARRDPTLMGDQMRRAWEDLIHVECSRGPLVIVLEDLHWGDLPTVSFVDAALRYARSKPLMVMALARPEIADLFPRLWSEREVVPVPMGELSPRSAEQLARAALGQAVDPKTLLRIVERAGGNAFFLEEIVRHVASGSGNELPDTVLAMVGSRIESLEPEARRVLRACSVFGQVFWRGGLLALLGGATDETLGGEWLDELAQRELVTARDKSKFEGEREFVFRHAFLRDAAYAMLTDSDKELGHRLAGEWLVGAGERDAMVLAEHFLRGKDPRSASRWFIQAAGQALSANDYDAVLVRASKAIEAGAEGETLGQVRLYEAEANRWRGHHEDAERHASQAMTLLPRGSPAWCAAVGEITSARHRLSDLAGLEALADPILELAPPFESHHLIVAFRLATSLLYAGITKASLRLADHVESAANSAALGDPAVAARIELYRGARAVFAGSPVDYLKWMRAAAESFERAGDARSACTPRGNSGFAYIELGEFEKAEAELRGLIASAVRMGLTDVEAAARHNLGIALGRQGRFAEGLSEERAALGVFKSGTYRRMEAATLIAMTEIELAEGRLDVAEQDARKAVHAAETIPPMHVYALALYASVLLARGDAQAAEPRALEAARLLESLGSLESGESLVHVVHAETAHVLGHSDTARSVIRKAYDDLATRADKIVDLDLKRSFLERVPDNARVVALAVEWGIAAKK
jgi:eukaryotic-like serine/threonine-protein kinase